MFGHASSQAWGKRPAEISDSELGNALAACVFRCELERELRRASFGVRRAEVVHEVVLVEHELMIGEVAANVAATEQALAPKDHLHIFEVLLFLQRDHLPLERRDEHRE